MVNFKLLLHNNITIVGLGLNPPEGDAILAHSTGFL